MKLVGQLPPKIKDEIISEIQKALWQNVGAVDGYWDPDIVCDLSTIEDIAAVMEQYGLRPDDPAETQP